MHRSLSCLAALALATLGMAQQTLVLPVGLVNGAGNSSNSFPFGTSAAGFPGLRVQCVYDSSNFTAVGVSTPIRITRLRWRANDSTTSWTGGTFAQGTVALATAAVDHTAVTTSFAQNSGPDRLTVYSGPITYRAGAGTGIGRAGPVVVDLPLTTPFVYDPQGGDLVVDVDYPGGSNYSGGTLSAMDVQTVAAASRVYASTSYPLANGTTPGHAVVVEVDYLPAAGMFAAFKASTSGGASPLGVQFTDASYSSAPGGVTGWAWDFDHDGIVDSTQQHPTHVFSACGHYTVSLTVTDGVHPAATAVQVDCIVTDEITADFTWQILAGNVVLFTDTSFPPATQQSWDLDGDGQVDTTGPQAAWPYSNPTAITNVTLTASRLCGAPASVTKPVLPTPALLTTFAGGNGLSGSGSGNMFDLDVLNPTGINVTSLTVCPLSTTTPIGAPIGCDVYVTDAPGGFVQNHAEANLWRRVAHGTGTFQGSTTTTTAVPTEMTLDHRFYLAPGSYSMAIHMLGCGLVYTTGNSNGSGLQFANADVWLRCGLAKPSPFSVSANSPRLWNGILHYELCSLGALSGYGYLAPGCQNSLGAVPHQQIVSLPTLGQTFAVTFDAAPQNQVLAFAGFSRTLSVFGPLPFDMQVLGAPGCLAHVSPDMVLPLAGSGGTATWSIALPNDPTLLCLPFFVQAMVRDPAANVLGWVAGDAAAGVVGN